MLLRITTALAAIALFAATAPAQAQDNPENGDTGQWQQPNNGGNGQNNGWGNGQGNNGNPPQGNGGQWNNGQNNGQGQGQGNGQWNNGQGNGQGQGQGQGNGQWNQDNEHPHTGGGAAGAGDHPAAAEGTNDFANDDNHVAVLHHLGVGFLGLQAIPIAGGPAAATAGGVVSAPMIGMRYWLTDLVGLEAGIGLGFTSLNASSGSVSIGLGSAFAIGFHVGLPLAIAHWKHFSFIAEPEIQVGFSSGSLPNAINPVDLFDDSYSGFVFRIGGRIGAEVQFGFIGVPQLSLQATVGLHLSYASTNSDICSNPMGGTGCPVDTSSTQSVLNISTGVFNDPWDIFVAGIRAMYYL